MTTKQDIEIAFAKASALSELRDVALEFSQGGKYKDPFLEALAIRAFAAVQKVDKVFANPEG